MCLTSLKCVVQMKSSHLILMNPFKNLHFKMNDQRKRFDGSKRSPASSEGKKHVKIDSNTVKSPTMLPMDDKKEKEAILKEFSNEEVDGDGVGSVTKLLHRHKDHGRVGKLGIHSSSSNQSTESGPGGRSVGISVKMNNATTRTRIDNLGTYHEYSYRAEQELVSLKDISHARGSGDRKMSILQNPDTQSHIILNEIRGFSSTDSPVTIVTGLMGTSRIFIRRGHDHKKTLPAGVTKLKGRIVREVLNHENKRIFFLKQTGSTPIWSFLLLYGFLRQTFQYTVVDRSGKPAMVVNGSQYLFGACLKSTIRYADGSFVGLMRQSFCDGAYTISDENMRIMFTVVGPVFSCYSPCVFWCFDEEFEICLSGSADEVGRIAKYWKTDEFQNGHNNVGASFPQEMSVRSKAMLFGALITLRWKYFVNGGNGVILILFYLSVLACGLVVYFLVIQ